MGNGAGKAFYLKKMNRSKKERISNTDHQEEPYRDEYPSASNEHWDFENSQSPEDDDGEEDNLVVAFHYSDDEEDDGHDERLKKESLAFPEQTTSPMSNKNQGSMFTTRKKSTKDLLSKKKDSFSSSKSAANRRRQPQRPILLVNAHHDDDDDDVEAAGLRKMHWKKGQLIGTGVYGNVYRGLNEDTGGFMAVKEYTWPQEEEKAAAHDMSPIQIEIEHLRTLLVHDNIVPYLGTELSTSNQCLYIFTEWVPGGNLKQLQQTYGKLSENLVRQYTWHILSGLRYLHDHDIVFRDLGLEQVLVDDQGRIKLADFCTSLKTRDRRRRKMTMLAPEVVQDACMYSPQSDIWSVGCIVYQLLCNACPSTVPQTEQGARVSSSGGFFSNPFGRGSTTSCPEDLREEAPRGIVDLSTQELSPEARDFLSTCLAEDPTDRSKTCRELLGHSFFTGTKKPTSNNNNNSLPMHHHYSSGMNKKNGLSSSTSSIHKSTELLRRRRGGGGGKKRATDVVAVVKRGAKASDTNNHKFKSLPSTGLEVFQKSPRQHSMMISSLEKETTHESLHRYSGNNNHSNNGQSDSESEVSNSGFLLQSSTTFRSSMNNSTRKIQSSEIILDDPACPVQAFTTLSKVPNITPRKGNNYKTEDDPVAVYPTVRRKSWSDRMEQPIATTFAKNKLEQEIESQKQRLAQKRRKERQWQAELAAEAAKAQVHEHRLSFS